MAIPESLQIEAAILLNKAHTESYRKPVDLYLISELLYRAIHISRSHGIAWYAGGVIYRRLGDETTATYYFREAYGRGIDDRSVSFKLP